MFVAVNTVGVHAVVAFRVLAPRCFVEPGLTPEQLPSHGAPRSKCALLDRVRSLGHHHCLHQESSMRGRGGSLRVGLWLAGGVLATVAGGIVDLLVDNAAVALIVGVVVAISFGSNIEGMIEALTRGDRQGD